MLSILPNMIACCFINLHWQTLHKLSKTNFINKMQRQQYQGFSANLQRKTKTDMKSFTQSLMPHLLSPLSTLLICMIIYYLPFPHSSSVCTYLYYRNLLQNVCSSSENNNSLYLQTKKIIIITFKILLY